jgi:uncharacterized protein YjbI with pentapeptide repeats
MAKEQEVASDDRLAAEGGIASDESALEVLEIEINIGPVEKPEKVPDENIAREDINIEAGCPIRMGYSGPKCGRTFHIAPDGIDVKPVCLMHSKDPRKQSGPLLDAFWLEFEKILEDAGEGEAHFERFVFPELNFKNRKLKASCRFNGATFTMDAHFNDSTFMHDATFCYVTFIQEVDFARATFIQDAEFDGAILSHDAEFGIVTFMQRASFSSATFIQDAEFNGVIFTQNAEFGSATFTKDALFESAIFMMDVVFDSATFMQDAIFGYATFTQAADFWHTKFHGIADWEGSKFLDRAEFRSTNFDPQNKGIPSAVFAHVKFSKPGKIVFDGVDLSRALFHNCDVSHVWFTSSVKWAKREGNHGLAVFEETIPLEQEVVEGLQRNGQRDYQAVAQIYQQLKKNYDSRLDYWTANEFHFGEMEMKRLAGPTTGRLLWLRRWWHRNLSFVAWYKDASDYGNSYRKPLLWLLGTLLAATLLFPIPGLELKQPISGNAVSTASVTYIRVWNRQESWTNNFWTEAKLIGKSGITAIDTATFQRTPEYTPVYPRGRVVAIVETLLTSSLFALFLLAIRRQFRR